VENTEAWFAIAKDQGLASIGWRTSRRFDHVINAVPKESFCSALDLITDPPEDEPYKQLKERLCVSHQLADFQWVEKLLQMEALGGRKTSEVLQEITWLCSTVYEESPFFLFLQRIPKELRIILGDMDDQEDVRAIATKADKLWSLHKWLL
jgi:hypothetical protein